MAHRLQNYEIIEFFGISDENQYIPKRRGVIPPTILSRVKVEFRSLSSIPTPQVDPNENSLKENSLNRKHNDNKIFDSYLMALEKKFGDNWVRFLQDVDIFTDRRSLREVVKNRCINLNYLAKNHYCDRTNIDIIAEKVFNTLFIACQSDYKQDTRGYGESFEAMMTGDKSEICDSIQISKFTLNGLRIAVAFRMNGLDSHNNRVELTTKNIHHYFGLGIRPDWYLQKWIQMRFGDAEKLIIGCLKENMVDDLQELSFAEVEEGTELTHQDIVECDNKLYKILKCLFDNIPERSSYLFKFEKNLQTIFKRVVSGPSILMSNERRLALYSLILPEINDGFDVFERHREFAFDEEPSNDEADCNRNKKIKNCFDKIRIHLKKRT